MTTRSLVFVTQVVDPDDQVLGVTASLIRGLAGVFDRVIVIGNEVRRRPPGLPANARVVSLGKERGAGRVERALAYERALWSARAADVLLAHMCPDYLTAAAPVMKVAGMRSMLWFAHPRDSRTLRAAERLADVVLTSLPGSYPRPSPKVRAIGQAVDVDAFPPTSMPDREQGLRLLALGRTSDSKRFDVAIDGVVAARAKGVDARLRIVGPATTPNEAAVRRRLETKIGTGSLGGVVTLEDGVPPSDVPSLLASCHALVNTTVSGSGDKTVFEAMAAGRPVLASNPPFRALLGEAAGDLMFEPGAAAQLGDRIAWLAGADAAALGTALRGRVIGEHSLDHWADQIRRIADEICGAAA